MRRLTLAAALLVGACAESSLTSGGALAVTSATPDHAPARGGTRITLDGAGFGSAPKLWVDDAAAKVVAAVDDALTFELPPSVAGPADVRIVADGADRTFDALLTLEPIALEFAEAPSWLVPVLAGPVTGLAPFDADLDGHMELLAATHDGLQVLTHSTAGALVAKAFVLAATPPEPAIGALAIDPQAGLAAVCTSDPAHPLRFVAAKDGGAAAGTDEPVPASPCRRLAFVAVEAGAPRWLVVDTEAGLAFFRPKSGKFEPVEVTLAALPAGLATLAAADLGGTGAEVLVVGGTEGAAPWLRLVELTPAAEGRYTGAVVDLPAPGGAPRALTAFDADADGDTDLYSCGDGPDALLVNDGHARFFDDAWRLLPFDRGAGVAVATSDLDLDGRPDIVVGSTGGPDRLFVASPDGYHDQTPALGLTGAAGTRALALLDVDRDGDVDVVTVDPEGHVRLRVLAGGLAP